ncbi:MAG: Uma2 family endonuclease [Salinivenus sp.]
MAHAVALTSSSEAPAAPRRFTADEYMRMAEAGILSDDDAVELIHGQIVEMSPGNPPHRVCVAKINRLLVHQLEGTEYFVQPQSTLPLDRHNLPEPDLAVLRGTPDDLMQGELDAVLVVEVADTSLDRDRTVKQSLYAQAGVPTYWIVNLRDRTIEVYREPDGETYRERRTRDADDSVALPGTAAPVGVAELLPAGSEA